MATELKQQLKSSLATSDARARTEWAQQIVEGGVEIESLLSLLHGDEKTAQRFTWLLGDVAVLEPSVIEPCMPLFFSLRNQMPFPGMQRSVAKWLGLTNVPIELEDEAIAQLYQWVAGSDACIASKSFAAKVLFEMAKQKRTSLAKVKRVVKGQIGTINRAYSHRMKKLLERLNEL